MSRRNLTTHVCKHRFAIQSIQIGGWTIEDATAICLDCGALTPVPKLPSKPSRVA